MSKVVCVMCGKGKLSELTFTTNRGPICGICLRKEIKRKAKIKAEIRKKRKEERG